MRYNQYEQTCRVQRPTQPCHTKLRPERSFRAHPSSRGALQAATLGSNSCRASRISGSEPSLKLYWCLLSSTSFGNGNRHHGYERRMMQCRYQSHWNLPVTLGSSKFNRYASHKCLDSTSATKFTYPSSASIRKCIHEWIHPFGIYVKYTVRMIY